MKTLIFLISFFSLSAFAEVQIGGHMGATSISQSGAAGTLLPEISYGAETYVYSQNFGLGLNYTYFRAPSAGQGAVTVGTSNNWLAFEGVYRLLSKSISPYVVAGVGPYLQTVTTDFMGQSEDNSATFLATDVGVGINTPFGRSWLAGVSIRYYQYSNVSAYHASFNLSLLL